MLQPYMIKNLFGIEGWNIAWYGVIIGTGLLFGIALASYRAKKENVKPELIYDFIIIALPVAIICARTYYVIFEWENYAADPIRVFAIWEGGLAIYGGVLGGLLTAIIFCRYKKIPLLHFLDLIVPSLVLGQVIGRWGNFTNQEAFGNIVTDSTKQFFPYAVFIEELGEWHQATFFYESMWNLCLLILMLIVSRQTHKKGSLLCLYFIGYGLGRFLIEGLRTDSLYILPGLRVSQILSLVLIVAGFLLWHFKIKKNNIREAVTNREK